MTPFRNPAGYSRNAVETAAFKPGVKRELVRVGRSWIISPRTTETSGG